nr:HEPN domain-containing protein [uncultured Methanoregula sp.]
MPSNSKRFQELEKSINYLTGFLLPSQKPSADYSLEELIRMRSHRILIHAEIESYFEDIAVDKIRTAAAEYKMTKKTGPVLAALFACSQRQTPVKLPDTHNKNRNFFENRLDEESTIFHNMVKNNHGIHQNNILQLLLSIGVCETEIDQTLLIDLDQLGTQRGEFAHTSISNKTKQKFDPSIERNRIKLWIPVIQKIDLIIMGLK